MSKPLVGIIMGSQSDLKIMSAAADMLEKFGIAFELTIVSAHRTPERMVEYGQTAVSKGLKCIIAGSFTRYGCCFNNVTGNWSTC
jgi:5-(carboxyamino)imidazole ribonucleotide mutase